MCGRDSLILKSSKPTNQSNTKSPDTFNSNFSTHSIATANRRFETEHVRHRVGMAHKNHSCRRSVFRLRRMRKKRRHRQGEKSTHDLRSTFTTNVLVINTVNVQGWQCHRCRAHATTHSIEAVTRDIQVRHHLRSRILLHFSRSLELRGASAAPTKLQCTYFSRSLDIAAQAPRTLNAQPMPYHIRTAKRQLIRVCQQQNSPHQTRSIAPTATAGYHDAPRPAPPFERP